ncbi:S-methylmethionine-dependent homocysteine/selenocysteine methylase [Aeromicrobium panaciterrae]|uniref:S-methylmethionine-dependent homocysteine/selenocysteine methylase n=1 Tax=Aeromicrobium panaciterrae TaxID=363861 RepID=A0ABU1UN98_9ACTN|nr:homocysteine S-methyltransferase family protein [Aeromicrobium panaciterrae]MDR7086600.1 S-methylmethionine-dependent homocysteine/selenocysteine methylase [Aeromicrobium panaciterrae]
MATTGFPAQKPGTQYLTEGGIETEIMYKWGHELPEFAMYPLLDNPAAMDDMRTMYRGYLDAAATHKMNALMGGLDYRASPDWGTKLGYSAEGLAEANLASIDFLRTLAAEYENDIDTILIQGFVGPRGDAYERNVVMTADEAEDYHSVQLTTLKQAGVDLAWGFTFNDEQESIGLARAAKAIGVPAAVSFTLTSDARVHSGSTLADAINTVDAATDGSLEFFAINCSHPVEFGPALTEGAWTDRLRAFRPNASKMEKIALCQIGHLEEGEPPDLASMMGDLSKRYPQVDIWGGCCGTGAEHLNLIAEAVS